MYLYKSNHCYFSFQFLEGVAKRMDCQFNKDERKAIRSFSDPLYKGVTICSEDLSVSFHKKKEVKLTQSWAIGFSILEISKLVMQKMWYQKIKPRFGEARVLMSDTDSWIMQVPATNEEEALEKLKDIMDFSNYDLKHPFHNNSRKNCLGFLKNEVPNGRIKEFTGLRSKTYAFLVCKIIINDKCEIFELLIDEEELESRAKGVKKAFRKKIPFKDFKDCLIYKQAKSVKQVGIIAKSHINYLIESEKIAFSSFDDKRFLMCPIHSCPYGSILINYFKNTGGKCYVCENPTKIM